MMLPDVTEQQEVRSELVHLRKVPMHAVEINDDATIGQKLFAHLCLTWEKI